MEYAKGYIFGENERPDVVAWTNVTENLTIEKIEPDSNGNTRYQIVDGPLWSDEEKSQIELLRETSLESRISALEDALAELMEG